MFIGFFLYFFKSITILVVCQATTVFRQSVTTLSVFSNKEEIAAEHKIDLGGVRSCSAKHGGD